MESNVSVGRVQERVPQLTNKRRLDDDQEGVVEIRPTFDACSANVEMMPEPFEGFQMNGFM
jgi:hypothetical protein